VIRSLITEIMGRYVDRGTDTNGYRDRQQDDAINLVSFQNKEIGLKMDLTRTECEGDNERAPVGGFVNTVMNL
jgi:hypothetical protein